MALTNVDLKAIADLMDQKLEPINQRLDMMDNRLDKMDNKLNILEIKQDRTAKKLDDLQLDVKIAERDIRRDIHTLNDEMETVIEILKLNEMIPR